MIIINYRSAMKAIVDGNLSNDDVVLLGTLMDTNDRENLLTSLDLWDEYDDIRDTSWFDERHALSIIRTIYSHSFSNEEWAAFEDGRVLVDVDLTQLPVNVSQGVAA